MTLRAEDLMVGDWVQLNGKPMQVSRIDLHSVNAQPAFCCGSPHNIWSYNNNFKPIIITAEILEKNGFAKVVENEHWCTYQLLIPTGYKETSYSIQFTFCNDPTSAVNTIFNCWGPISSEGRGVNDINMCNIESAHELQHVLKLCGIEKTIEL